MKKLMATLLTACLAFQSCFVPALFDRASNSVKAANTAETATSSSEYFQKTATGVSISKESEQKDGGALEIEVRSSSLFPYKGKVSVGISNGNNYNSTKELDFSNTEALNTGNTMRTAHFDVPEGSYFITISADKFATYEQKDIEVKAGSIHKIVVSSSKITTETKEVNTGWLRIGDINGDQKINKEDTETLLSHIRKDESTASNSDLNNDGKIDITDLQYVVQNMKEKEQLSSIEKLALYKEIKTEEGTEIVNGNIIDLTKGQEITLKRAEDTVISKEKPVKLSIALPDSTEKIGGMRLLAPGETTEQGTIDSDIRSGTVLVYSDENEENPLELTIEETKASKSRKVKAAKTSTKKPSVTTESDGSLILDFAGQIAVKRVTIKISGTKKNDKLVNIAKVEFVNDMEKRIPAPALDVPALQEPIAGDEQITVSWTRQTNVTGYELFVEGPVKNGTASQIISVAENTYTISAINDESLINFEEYTIKVRSVNGDWRSQWSKEIIGIPEPTALPDPPDYVTTTDGFHSLRVQWKAMSDSKGYMVYYKKAEEAKDQYKPVVDGFEPVKEGTGKLEDNTYTISGLENGVTYTVYVIGWNQLGWGKPSLEATGTPKEETLPILPSYKLLNTSNGEGKVSAHITDATIGGHGGASMQTSPLDTTAKSAFGLVDNDYSSYWSKTDWDDGVSYVGMDKGMFLTFDNEYEMNYFTFAAVDEVASLEYARIEYWNSETGTDNNARKVIGCRLLRKQDENGKQFYIAKFDSTVKVNKIHICFGRAYSRAEMKVGEIRFYQYDSLEDDIMDLYVDEMHTTLRTDVNAQTVEDLKQRLETEDEVSKEKHPLYKELKLELENAEYILTHENLSPSYEVDNRITAKKDGHLGFGGLNAWQPLGKVAYAGETLVVYVGHNTKRTGDNAELQLIMTQQHAEANSFMKASNLKVGRNEITVPQIGSTNCERGGQIYIAYTGNNVNDKYAVRVLGGSDIPVLSVYGKTGIERTNAIKTYITELESYVTTIESKHNEIHKDSAKTVNYDYDRTNCILNATDIMMDQMMYSLPAEQALAGIKNASDKVAALDNALKGMEDTMQLFYHHKGLSNQEAAVKNSDTANVNRNALPSQHLNIRYMRMFAGAFMYASGNHIGIEWGSTALTGTTAFGWGIAHEIGHDINQGTYAVAEVTNNYFAQLLTGKERYTYENVYKKVTSGTVGRASNVFTQLALYWQLHMAFDNNKDDQYMYATYEEQFANLFFARVDTYCRNPKKAPQEGLTLNGGTDQNLMRLSCAAANKNILPFFERWGMIPDEDTIAYAKKYGEPEKKALYYINADARNYRVDHKNADGTITETNTILDKDVVTAEATANANQVQLTIATNQDKELILGYEIIRSMTSNGVTESKVVGFQPINTKESTVFVDTVSTINNRVMTYTVKAVDKFLNYSKAASAGSVKIQTDGVLDKTSWTVETTMTSENDAVIEAEDDNPDSGYDASNPNNVVAKKVNSIERILDNKKDADGTYQGKVTNGSAEITIDMHEVKEITALKYEGSAVSSITVMVSNNGMTWIPVKENYTNLKGSETAETIWFDSVEENERQNWIGTYDARYVKLTIAQEGTISIKEIEICGPSGDNLEFLTAVDNTGDASNIPAIGVLKDDYKYGDKAEDVIPKGSLIFSGIYKGNPAYNIVILYDTEGNVIGVKDDKVEAKQVIFADVPENGNLGETSNGTWIYYIEPNQWDLDTLKTIKGVRGELYRVDNAKTLEGERIVSDTKIITIPTQLPEITLTGSNFSE